jgi:hypothetical protein
MRKRREQVPGRSWALAGSLLAEHETSGISSDEESAIGDSHATQRVGIKPAAAQSLVHE